MRAADTRDLTGTVVAVRGGTPVILSDVAEVLEAPAVRRGIAHRLAGEVVSCRVVKQFGADTVKVAAGIRAAVAEISRSLPKGVELRIVYDQSDLVRSALSGVGRAVLLGAVFVVLVLFALSETRGPRCLVTLTIPLSLALAGVLLRWAEVGINTMTLGGLAIAVGLLVDTTMIMTRTSSTAERPPGEAAHRPDHDGCDRGRPAHRLRHPHHRRCVRSPFRHQRDRGAHVPPAGRGGSSVGSRVRWSWR